MENDLSNDKNAINDQNSLLNATLDLSLDEKMKFGKLLDELVNNIPAKPDQRKKKSNKQSEEKSQRIHVYLPFETISILNKIAEIYNCTLSESIYYLTKIYEQLDMYFIENDQ